MNIDLLHRLREAGDELAQEKAARHKAEAALGPKFDIKGFHDLLIGSGSQPLPVLERRVDAWIATRRG